MLQNNNTWRIFTFFCDEPSRRFHLRELSRLANIATPSVINHIKALLEEKIIVKDTTTLYPTYKANWGDEEYHFYKRLYNLISLKESGLVQTLENAFTPDCIILFGSYEKGEDREDGDIDLFLQAEDRKPSVKTHETHLKRSIQLHCEEDLENLSPELANNIADGTVLAGFARWKGSSGSPRTRKGPQASSSSQSSDTANSPSSTRKKKPRLS